MTPSILGEGNTPCISSKLHGRHLWFKLESSNPTGSYKDRFAAPAICTLASHPPPLVIATSSGNTGAALAAYCARFAMRLAVVAGPKAPQAKLSQIRAHGARVLPVLGFTEDSELTAAVLKTLEDFARRSGSAMLVSAFQYCPEAMCGVSAIADELAPFFPSHVFIPVGGGGLFTAVARGFRSTGLKAVKCHAVQPVGGATVAGAWLAGAKTSIPMPGHTRISGLSVPLDLDATTALELLYECGGAGIAVSDHDILDAQRVLFREEGIAAEPAGAASFAGYREALRRGLVAPDERCVCLVTGHALKDAASLEFASPPADPPLEAALLPDLLDRMASHAH